jgi:hypothetical protein
MSASMAIGVSGMLALYQDIAHLAAVEMTEMTNDLELGQFLWMVYSVFHYQPARTSRHKQRNRRKVWPGGRHLEEARHVTLIVSGCQRDERSGDDDGVSAPLPGSLN